MFVYCKILTLPSRKFCTKILRTLLSVCHGPFTLIVDETLVLLHRALGSLWFTCIDSWEGCCRKSAPISNTKELGPQIHFNSPLSLGREIGNGPLVPLLHELSSSSQHNRIWPTSSLQLTIKESLQNDKNQPIPPFTLIDESLLNEFIPTFKNEKTWTKG